MTFSVGQFLSVRSLLIATMTWYSGFFLLYFVARFACNTGQPAKHLGSNFIWRHHHQHLAIVDDRPINRFFFTCYTVLTRPNKVETAVRGCYSWFHFRLYHVVVSLSFLHSISLASLFSKCCLVIFTKIKLLIINRDSSVGAFCRCLVENLFISLRV